MATFKLYTGQSSRTAQLAAYYSLGSGWNAYTLLRRRRLGPRRSSGPDRPPERHTAAARCTSSPRPEHAPTIGAAPVRIGQGFEGYSPFGLDRLGPRRAPRPHDPQRREHDKLFLVPGISYRGPSNSTLIEIGTGY